MGEPTGHEGIASSPFGMSFRDVSPPEDKKGMKVGREFQSKYIYMLKSKHAGQTMSLNRIENLGEAYKENFTKANHLQKPNTPAVTATKLLQSWSPRWEGTVEGDACHPNLHADLFLRQYTGSMDPSSCRSYLDRVGKAFHGLKGSKICDPVVYRRGGQTKPSVRVS